jgi:hypothetical protein
MSTPRLERLAAGARRLCAAATAWRALSICLIGSFLFVESAWQVFLAPTDLRRYQCYALLFWLGGRATQLLPAGQCAFLHVNPSLSAFQELPLEYPPLALLPFSVALVLPPPYYALGFALLMLAVATLMLWLLQRYVSRRAMLIGAALLVAGGSALFQVRYDLLPALCVLLCVLAAQGGRWRLAYLALAVGTLLKLYPLLGLPSLWLAEQRAMLEARPLGRGSSTTFWRELRWQNCLLFVTTVGLVSGLFALLNAQAAFLAPLRYFAERPVQIESLQSSLLWLAAHAGLPTTPTFSYGSLNLLSPASGLLSGIGATLLLAGLLLTLWLQGRGVFDLATALLVLYALLIITGKVFSPQYFIWIIPLIACSQRSQQREALPWLLCWAFAGLLTTFSYVVFYPFLADPASASQVVLKLPGFFETLLVRNLLFLIATLAPLVEGFRKSL